MNPEYEILIIGGGPGGLTAGMYGARGGQKTVIIEKTFAGGQIAISDFIENYPGFVDGLEGWELGDKMKRQAEKFGAEFKTEEVLSVSDSPDSSYKIVKTDSGEYTALSIIIATGARSRPLMIPGEKEFLGKGVSTCATCDGSFFRDQEVAVIGGGDTAVQEAIFLTRFCSKVTLIHRREQLRAARAVQDRMKKVEDKLKTVLKSTVIEIMGGEKVEGISIRNVETDEISDMPVSGVFVFVGYIPNTNFLKDYVELDRLGYIITDDNMKTSKDGVFACGDVRKKLFKQVITACGEGATAAHSAYLYVEELMGRQY